ncbi:neurotrophin 1-like [Battus philenor]|uniref:neurotrophin 1-like n=1 Tax=Battus philenor TaxID=42288 RepID=UPI0035CEDE3E
MAWLYSCVIWISLINISAHTHTSRHYHRKTRAAQRNEGQNSGVIFPDMLPHRNSFKPKIPEECKDLSVCKKVIEYPHNYVSRLVQEIYKESIPKFNKDVIEPKIAQRIGPEEENLELCSSVEELHAPEAAKDTNNDWYYILNNKKEVNQTFRVEICRSQSSECNSVVHFAQGYKGRCTQKYIQRSMVALDYNGKMIDKYFPVPSCCSCIYGVIDN